MGEKDAGGMGMKRGGMDRKGGEEGGDGMWKE